MERLTIRTEEIGVVPNCYDCKSSVTSVCSPRICKQRLLNRLAEYEDLGLSPTELKSLLKSVKEVMPCDTEA